MKMEISVRAHDAFGSCDGCGVIAPLVAEGPRDRVLLLCPDCVRYRDEQEDHAAALLDMMRPPRDH